MFRKILETYCVLLRINDFLFVAFFKENLVIIISEFCDKIEIKTKKLTENKNIFCLYVWFYVVIILRKPFSIHYLNVIMK